MRGEKFTPPHAPYTRGSSLFLHGHSNSRDGRRGEIALKRDMHPGRGPQSRGRRPHPSPIFSLSDRRQRERILQDLFMDDPEEESPFGEYTFG